MDLAYEDALSWWCIRCQVRTYYNQAYCMKCEDAIVDEAFGWASLEQSKRARVVGKVMSIEEYNKYEAWCEENKRLARVAVAMGKVHGETCDCQQRCV